MFAPVFILIAAPVVLHERLTLRKLLCVAAALLGMALVSGLHADGFSGADTWRGMLLGLAAAVIYAVVVLLNKRIHDVAAYDITLYNNARTEHKLIDLIRAETLTGVRSDYYTVSDKDLFDGGGVIEGLTWYDGSDTGFTLTLDEFVSLGENTPAQVAVSVAFDD